MSDNMCVGKVGCGNPVAYDVFLENAPIEARLAMCKPCAARACMTKPVTTIRAISLDEWGNDRLSDRAYTVHSRTGPEYNPERLTFLEWILYWRNTMDAIERDIVSKQAQHSRVILSNTSTQGDETTKEDRITVVLENPDVSTFFPAVAR